MFPTPLVRRLLLPLVAALVAVAPGSAQPAADEEPRGVEASFLETVDVDVVSVDVVVTDAAGEFLPGLEIDDFEILEDGRPVKVTHFYAQAGSGRGRSAMPGRPEIAPPAAPGMPPPAGATEAPTVAPPPEEQQVWLVVYVDNLFLRPFDRNKVLRAVRHFLRREVAAGDRVMVVSFDRSLHVRQPFTGDLRVVLDELVEQETLSAFGVEVGTARTDVLRRIRSAQHASEALNHADFFAKEIDNDLESSLRALRELVSSLAGLPGRKVLLHVSNGLPMTPGEDVFHFYDVIHPDSGFSGRMVGTRYDARRRYRELTAHANTNRVVFYTFEGRGLRSHGSLSAEHGSMTDRDQMVTGSMVDVDFVKMANEQEPLQLLAEETGGVATVGTNNLDGGLDRLARDLRSYYSLGYSSANAGDGRYHTIEVVVRDPRAKEVRHRTGYRSKGVPTRVAEGTLAALLHGVEQNPLAIELELGRPQPTEERGHWLVPVVVRVPLRSLTLLPRGESHEGRLRVSLAALDDEGGTSGVQQSEIPLSIPAADIERALGQSWIYEAQLLMRPGEQHVAVGVRDDLAGDSSFIQRRLEVGG